MLGKKLSASLQSTKDKMNSEQMIEKIEDICHTVGQIQEEMEIKWEEIGAMNAEIIEIRAQKPSNGLSPELMEAFENIQKGVTEDHLRMIQKELHNLQVRIQADVAVIEKKVDGFSGPSINDLW
jgi:SMC interacting uncharacterized protein involved in chromosome segregation